ncbi:ECF RNA polymerase sigma factor SigE [compost metagenome]
MLAETRKMLNAGIDQLPPQQKAVYLLCKEEGMKYEDVARQLNLSVETVRSHMKHALRFLRNFMSEHTDIATLAVMLKIFF